MYNRISLPDYAHVHPRKIHRDLSIGYNLKINIVFINIFFFLRSPNDFINQRDTVSFIITTEKISHVTFVFLFTEISNRHSDKIEPHSTGTNKN